MSSPFKIVTRILCGAIAAVALSSLSSVRAQTTIHVPADQPTIQAAINAANNGDTVLVAPGTYLENINFNGKAITVTSSAGPSVTIIDGNHNGTVVTFSNSETPSSVLSGLTIRNGFQNGGFGAGISITSASPTITNNTITGNHAATGIGIFVNGGSSLIQHNTISNNDQTGAGDGGSGGGGILVFGSSSATVQIIGNTITSNSLQGGGQGGGISVAGGGALLQGNLISGNVVYNDGGGITAYNIFAPLTIVENVLVNNTALSGKGGGINLSLPSSSASVFVTNNTIANNTGYANTSGVYTTGFAQPTTLANNIIVAPANQNPVTCDGTYSTASPTFAHNDAYGIGSSSSGFFGFCVADSTNISLDPLFINPSNNLRLQSSSPAVDAGSNSASGLPSTDFDGNPRIVDGNGDGVAVVDMGAYELQPTTITLSPNSLTFNPQPAGTTSSPQTVTLTNTGGNNLYLSLSGSAPFSETDNCGGVVPAGASCSISVTFAPQSDGSFTGGITVRDNAPQNPQTVSVTGTGGVPTASLTPSSLSFGGQPVGTTSASQTVTLSNTGNGPLTISGISTTGDFSQASTCSSLASGASCSISVTFTPTAVGARQGTLTVSDNASGSPQTVSLNGTGLTAIGSLSPASLSFGNQIVGTTSAAQIATLSNNGGLSLSISGIAVSGPFSQTNNCGSTVAPGSSCAISVTFRPVFSGAASGSLTVTDASGKTYTSSLSGTAVDFAISASPNSAAAVRGGSATFTVIIAPVGGPFGSPVSLSCTGLPSNSSCSFSPQNSVPGSAGSSSIMTIITNSNASPGTFTVAVTGISGALSHSTQVQLIVTKKR